jgi:hypothetical protein
MSGMMSFASAIMQSSQIHRFGKVSTNISKPLEVSPKKQKQQSLCTVLNTE